MRSEPSSPKIMIVDDNPNVARSLAALLQREGFHTTVCHTGTEALDAVEQSIPDAALVDIHLPDISGLVLTHKLRERLGPEAPIFIVSGDSSMEVINSLSHVGATRFYRKPVHFAVLLDSLRESVA
jgi:CheY-like chemotaxis protein